MEGGGRIRRVYDFCAYYRPPEQKQKFEDVARTDIERWVRDGRLVGQPFLWNHSTDPIGTVTRAFVARDGSLGISVILHKKWAYWSELPNALAANMCNGVSLSHDPETMEPVEVSLCMEGMRDKTWLMNIRDPTTDDLRFDDPAERVTPVEASNDMVQPQQTAPAQPVFYVVPPQQQTVNASSVNGGVQTQPQNGNPQPTKPPPPAQGGVPQPVPMMVDANGFPLQGPMIAPPMPRDQGMYTQVAPYVYGQQQQQQQQQQPAADQKQPEDEKKQPEDEKKAAAATAATTTTTTPKDDMADMKAMIDSLERDPNIAQSEKEKLIQRFTKRIEEMQALDKQLRDAKRQASESKRQERRRLGSLFLQKFLDNEQLAKKSEKEREELVENFASEDPDKFYVACSKMAQDANNEQQGSKKRARTDEQQQQQEPVYFRGGYTTMYPNQQQPVEASQSVAYSYNQQHMPQHYQQQQMIPMIGPNGQTMWAMAAPPQTTLPPTCAQEERQKNSLPELTRQHLVPQFQEARKLLGLQPSKQTENRLIEASSMYWAAKFPNGPGGKMDIDYVGAKEVENGQYNNFSFLDSLDEMRKYCRNSRLFTGD